MHGEDVVELRMLAGEKELLRAPIVQLIKQAACGGFTVTTGSSCFLVISFERTRHLVMHDKTDVRFVDSHSKRVRGYDRFQFTIHKRVLVLLAFACFHAPVILL